MPIYEYRCTACQTSLQKLQKISEAPLKQCPNCHKDSLEKLISRSAFKLEGTGWYETDFKNKSAPAPTASATPETIAATQTAEVTTPETTAKAAHTHSGEGCC
jgi:putative FmdB family regulatory protein